MDKTDKQEIDKNRYVKVLALLEERGGKES